ncbi:LOW QUALITY PROTEIN: Eukaryotic/viral aspartic protease [Phytophthora megakarya]|uniref:Eukaryotic/viral aspartic protease n=1 Tax=Phytophthora megakarya TaxID=4795 RepID=A0A225W9Y7_9STRA|nr:LOW QUALITY PROTEIN: Eukaryotic/viral aspartic protease [Phytophthora megakarya]
MPSTTEGQAGFDYEPRSEEKESDNGEKIKLCSTSYAVERRGPSRLRLDTCFEDTEFDHHANDEDDYVDNELEDTAPVQESDLHDDADVFVTRVVTRCHATSETNSKKQANQSLLMMILTNLPMTRSASKLTTKKDGNRPPINGATPAANKTLGQCLNAMLDTSSWIQLFTPNAARQAVWAELVEELSYPVNSTSTSQVAEDTVSLLMAMGMDAHAYPSPTTLADGAASEAGSELQRCKRKLKTAFGSKDVGAGRQQVARSAGERVNPANIPLPRTPKKTAKAVFGSAEQSPYFHNSHMNRKVRIVREAESTANTRPGTRRSSSRRQVAADDSSSDEGNPFYQSDDDNDATTELAW